MSTRHTTQTLGFLEETVEGTSLFTADITNDTYYVFGAVTATPGYLPNFENIYIPYYTSGIETDEVILVDQKVKQSLAFVITNGLMLYYLHGDVTNAGNTTHTLAYHKFPNTFTIRWETGYSANKIIREIKACKVQSVVLNYDFTKDTNPMTMGINLEGRIYGDATDNNTFATTELVHPGTTTTTADPAYFKDLDTTNQILQWDSTTRGSVIDWTTKLFKVTLRAARAHVWTKFHNNTVSSKLHSGKVTYSVEFILLRDDDSDFYADYEAKYQDNLQIKLYAAANTYIDVDMQDIALSSVKPNYAIIEGNEVPVWECVGIPTKVVTVVRDGVLDTLYEDKA